MVEENRGNLWSQLRDIARGSAVLVIVRVLGMAISFLLMLFLARTLSSVDFGRFTVMFSATLLGGLLLTLNLGAGSVRFLSEFVSADDPQGGASYLGFTRKVVLVTSTIAWVGLFLAVVFWWLGWAQKPPMHVLLAVLLAPLFAWLRVHAAHVAALGQVIRAALPMTLIRPVVLFSLIVLTYWLIPPLVLAKVFWCFAFVAVTVFLVQRLLFVQPLSPFSIAPRESTPGERQQWTSVGLKLLIPTLFLELSIDTIVVVSSWVLSIEDVATLGIVLRIQAIILFGVTSINMVVAPRIAKAHAAGKTEDAQRLVVASAHLKLWPSLVVLVALFFLGDTILGAFGNQYRDQILPLIIVSVTPLVMALFGPVVLFVTILDLQSRANRVFVSAIVLLVVLIVVLGHFFGLVGVALSTVLVWLWWNFWLYRIIKKNSNYNTLQPIGSMRDGSY